MKDSSIVFEDRPAYDIWLKLILVAVIAFVVILGILFLDRDTEGALRMFGLAIFTILALIAVLPRRFQIFEDRLKIRLGGPLTVNIPLSNIVEAKPAPARKVFAFWGSRFATSTHHVVEIVQKKGSNLVISPKNDDMFIQQLNQARQSQSS